MRRRLLTLPLVLGVLLPLAPAQAAHPLTQACGAPHTSVAFVQETEAGSYSVRHLAPGLGCETFLERAGVTGWSTPALDRAGERIVVDVDGPAGARVLQVFERSMHRARPLTEPVVSDTATVRDARPAWSPDGQRVLFTRSTRSTVTYERTSALFTVPSAGGTPTQVPGTEGALSGSWSPDGTRIAYDVAVPDPEPRRHTERGALVVSGVDGSGRTDLGQEGMDPAWSPDGSQIAFVTITDERFPPFMPALRKVGLMSPSGGPVRLLEATGVRAAARHPSWLPDGQSLVYSQLRTGMDGRSEEGGVWAVDVSGLRSAPLYDGPRNEALPSAGGPRPAAVTGGAPSTFTALPPRRVLDTRPDAPVAAGGVVDATVTGQPCPAGCAELAPVVPADATAVVLTVTVVAPTASTDVAVYPAGAAQPGSSNVNAAAGSTVANAVLVPVGVEGKVRLRNSAGTAHLVVDVAGYFRAGDGGAGYAASEPRRILDTRSAVGAPARKVGPAGTLDLQVVGELPHADGGTVRVPDDATAVVLNLTATGATASTDVRAYPRRSDDRVPHVSNLNLRRGQTAASLVTVAVGDQGQVRLRNAGGEVHLVADLAGWYSPTAPARFVPAVPSRFLDTRTGLGAAPAPLSAGELLDLGVAGARGVPAGATAAVVNLTGTLVSASTDVRAYPAGAGAVPTVSNLNLIAGATRANLAVVPTGADGRVRLRSSAGQLALVADLAGWFVPR